MLRKMIAAILMVLAALAVPSMALEIDNVSPTKDVGVWTEPGYYTAPELEALNEMATGTAAADSQQIVTPEEYRNILATPEPKPADTPTMKGVENLVPKLSDGVADGAYDTTKVCDMIDIVLGDNNVTLVTDSDVALKIPAGSEMVHYLGATTVLYTFEADTYLANIKPLTIEDIKTSGLRYGNIEIRKLVSGEGEPKRYETIATINIRGSLKVAV